MSRLAPCVMVVGTASSVGKSVVATALCRVLREEGLRVAPFKAQNMSLNAAVTAAGEEIGRAQAAQADAAGVPPSALMNPILLKPESDSRSQLVVLGRARGTVAARDYWREREDLWPIVRDALRELRRQYDAIVIEGAGSAAEINLRRTDVANMRVAVAARAATLLVADIERGGVFAQIHGTLALMRRGEVALVKGVLVNKFRGDPTLFSGGVVRIRRLTGVPVLGVLPYAEDLGVPPEDSLSLDDVPKSGALDVAVMRYPHTSNFDDFTPLAEAGATFRYVRAPNELGVPDLLVLPGSKTTIDDLEWLRASGLAAQLLRLVDAGVPVIGICGGFQMLGRELSDPAGVEGPPRAVRGLGLLPIRTTFTTKKLTVRVRGNLSSGAPFEGYEMHVGDTDRDGSAPFAQIERDDLLVADGAVSEDGRVSGTYVHGLFANAAVRDELLATLARRRGISFTPRALPADRYAALSTWFREAVDVRRLMRVTGVGRG